MEGLPEKEAVTLSPTPPVIRAQIQKIETKYPEASVMGFRSDAPWKGPEHLRIGEHEYCIAQCDSVLQLRERLLRAEQAGERLAVITPLEDREVGLDVVARFARRRFFRLHVWDLVRDLYGIRAIDPRIVKKPRLGRALIEDVAAEDRPPLPSGTLDVETAWGLVLHARYALDGPRPDVATLLRWSQNDAGVRRFVQEPEDVRADVRSWLMECAGKAGIAMLSALLKGEEQSLFAWGLVLPLLTEQGGGDLQRDLVRISGRVDTRLGHPISPEVTQPWGEEAARLFEGLRRNGRRGDIEHVVQEANRILEELHIPELVARSPILPGGFEARLQHLGELVAKTASGRARTVPTALEDALQKLERHSESRHQPARMERARMAVRLVRWLVRGRAMPEEPGTSSSLVDVVRNYVREGAWIDRARQVLSKGEAHAAVAATYARLSDLVRGQREEMNEAFATHLAAWTREGSPRGELLRIEEILQSIVAPLATTAPVFLIVMDGMSQSVFLELMEDVERAGWELQGKEEGRLPGPALAALPTVTQVSRASLLTGHLTSGGQDVELKGFRSHEALVKACRAGKPPKLFHQTTLKGASRGEISPELRRAIATPEERVLSVVINAVDDHLEKGEQLAVRWDLEHVPLLRHLLDLAHQAGRVVVMTSDHGHVMDEATTYRKADPGERWRRDEGKPEPGEIRIEGSRVASLAEGAFIAPWSEGVRYGSKKNGYHGGVSPQEVIVPLAVLASGTDGVRGWQSVFIEPPSWWHGLEEPAPRVQQKPSSKAKKEKVAQKLTPSLFDEPDHVAIPEWITSFRQSPIYASQRELHRRVAPDDDLVTRFLAAMDRHGGSALRASLARELGVTPFRLNGVLAVISRVLNVDAYPIVELDTESDTVRFDRALFRKQFELEDKS